MTQWEVAATFPALSEERDEKDEADKASQDTDTPAMWHQLETFTVQDRARPAFLLSSLTDAR